MARQATGAGTARARPPAPLPRRSISPERLLAVAVVAAGITLGRGCALTGPVGSFRRRTCAGAWPDRARGGRQIEKKTTRLGTAPQDAHAEQSRREHWPLPSPLQRPAGEARRRTAVKVRRTAPATARTPPFSRRSSPPSRRRATATSRAGCRAGGAA